MSKKRRRDPGSIDTQLVEIYDDLANESEEIRLKAAHSLLHKVSGEFSTSKEKLTDILVRLIRGLCSGRKAARLGFSIAFTEFLVQVTSHDGQIATEPSDFLEVFNALLQQTEIGGNVSGQEERDYQLGRLFGAEAVIKSGVPFKYTHAKEAWSRVLNLVFELAQKKAWLREECGWILYKSIESLKAYDNGVVYAQSLIDKLNACGLAKSPEGVALWLGIQSTFPSVILPPLVWHKQDPLHRKEKATLANTMKDASAMEPLQAETTAKVAKNTTWSSSLHFAWDVILASLIQQHLANQIDSIKTNSFADFWTEAVDNSLFSASASDQRKYWGFVLFQRAVSSTPVPLIQFIFSKNFLRCLTNQLASSDRYLHRSAEKAVKSINARIESEPRVAVKVLACLLKPPNGRINFDQVTKTKTVEKLLAQVDDHDLSDLLQMYSALITKPNAQDEKSAAVERQIAADHLLSVVRTRHTVADADSTLRSEPTLFVQQVLALLAKYTYFEQREKTTLAGARCSPPILEPTRSVFRGRISSCLIHILAKAVQPAGFVYELINYIRSQEASEDGHQLTLEHDISVTKSINKGWSILQKVHTKAVSAQGSKKRLLSAFELLYALTLLQVYNGDADAVNMLDDLKDCYDNLIKHKSRSQQAGSDGLLEILLSFVAKPSSLFRRLASQVFSTCTTDISESGLQSMIKILETKESVSGQKELFDQENMDGEEGAASDDEVDEDGSVDEEADSSDDQSDDAMDTDEDANDDADVAAAELAEFDAKLALSLGTRPAMDDINAKDDEESSDEDMNDEQMEALDQHIEKIFQERKNAASKKTQNKDAKEAIVNFKSRVLELLDIYIKQEHKNPLALQLLVPLLHVIRTTKSHIVSSKACDLIGNYFRICKPNSVPYISNIETSMALLRTIHQQASMEGSNAYSSACSRASLLIVKALATQDQENLRLVEAVYGQTHQDFMLSKKARTKPSFFSDWLNWSVTARKA